MFLFHDLTLTFCILVMTKLFVTDVKSLSEENYKKGKKLFI